MEKVASYISWLAIRPEMFENCAPEPCENILSYYHHYHHHNDDKRGVGECGRRSLLAKTCLYHSS